MFSFKDGRKEPGICINKYNLVLGQVEYYFVPQANMQAYKVAFDKYEKEVCNSLIFLLKPEDVVNIRSVSLNDYKVIMQLVQERNQLMKYQQ
jgi:hypothetical protein